MIINWFIWKAKPSRVKAKMIQQTVKNGGFAVRSTLSHYRAAHLVVVTQWWMKDLDGGDCWWLEQDRMKIPLHEWILLKYQSGKCTVRRALVKTCRIIES